MVVGRVDIQGMAEDRLNSRGEIDAAIVEACPGLIMVLDGSLTCVHANPAAAALTGAPATLIGQRPFETIFAPQTGSAQDWEGTIRAAIEQGRQESLEVLVGPSEARRRLELQIVPIGEARGARGTVCVFARDVTVARQREDTLVGQATQDPLTGLLNLVAFREQVEEAMRGAAAGGSEIALVVGDLDYLKVLNDTYGHRAGDRALQSVATALATVLRPDDAVARLGGDEFGWLLKSGDRPSVERSAWRAVRAVEAAPTIGDRALSLSVGVGFRGSSFEVDELFERADSALYEAKARGRGLVVVAGKTEIGYRSQRPPGTSASVAPPDLSEAADVQSAARSALREWVHVLACSGGCVDLLDVEGDQLTACAFYRFGHDDWELSGETYALSDYPSTAAAIAGRRTYACRIDDPEADPAEAELLRGRGFSALLLTPLVAGSEVLGVVELFDSRVRTFTAAERRVALALASHLAPLLLHHRAGHPTG